MVACDAARALLVGAMLLPRHEPRRADRTPLSGDDDPAAVRRGPLGDRPRHDGRQPLPAGAPAVLQSTTRVVLVAGAAIGGLVVALFGARPALAADALTFVASGLLILFGTRARPAAAIRGRFRRREPAGGSWSAGVRLVFGDPALRTLMCLGWLAAFYEVPEGLAAPYAARLGGGAVAAGLLIAFSQLGAAVATPIFIKKIGPLTRLKWMGPMAVLSLRCPGGGDCPPGPRRLDGDLRPVQHVRDVSDRREHRVRRADTERAPRSGLRPRQRGSDTWVRGWLSL